MKGSYDAIQDYFYEQRWSDGLPVVPPTEQRVAEMLKATSHSPDEVVTDSMLPEELTVNVEKVAVVDSDGTIHVPRQALREAVTALDGYKGLTGTLSCADKDFGKVGTAKGDCATGEALGVFQITEAEVNEGNWPPPVVYTP